MRTILPPTGDYDLRVFLPLAFGHLHVYIKFDDTLPGHSFAKEMSTTKLLQLLLFPYLRSIQKNIDPRVPVHVDTLEMVRFASKRGSI